MSTTEFADQKRHATLEIWNHVVSIRRDSTPPHVLEIGTGGDGFVNFIPDAFCVGLEPLLFKMRRSGVGIFLPSAHFVCGVGERLPFHSDSFDVAFLYNVLDHAAEPGAILDELPRVLRAGGILHFLVDTYSLSFKVYRKFLRPDSLHPHTFTPREIHRMLASRRFRLVEDHSDLRPVGRRRNRKIRAFYRLEK